MAFASRQLAGLVVFFNYMKGYRQMPDTAQPLHETFPFLFPSVGGLRVSFTLKIMIIRFCSQS